MKKSKKKTISGIIASILIIAYAAFYTISLTNSIKTAKVDVEKQNAKIEETGASTTYQRLADVVQVGDFVNYTPDTASSYSLTTAVSGYSTNQTIPQESLSWRVMSVDKTSGTIEIVSANPTSTSVYLEGASGYNNGVYVLNDICEKQYSNSSLGATARSIKIEDIENQFNSTGTSAKNSYVNGYHKYGEIGGPCSTANAAYTGSSSSSFYPILYAQEIGAGINTSSVKTSGLKQSDIGNNMPISSGNKYLDANISGLTAKTTSYFISKSNSYFNNDSFSDVIFVGESFIASRYALYSQGQVIFGLGTILSNALGFEMDYLFQSFNHQETEIGRGIRPVVTLNGNVYTTGDIRNEENPTNAYQITKLIEPTSIDLSPGTENIGVGVKVKLPNVIYTPTDANINTDITWTSSNPSVLTIDQEGNMTGISQGTAVITATTANGIQKSKTITVRSISLNSSSGTAYVGGSNITTTISGNYSGIMSLRSSDENIATVTRDSNILTIHPVSKGTATITIIGNYGETATYTVEVKETSISLNNSTGFIREGRNIQVAISGNNMGTLSATSSDNNIATVTIDGTTLTITANQSGTSTITVKEGNGNKTATYTVTVVSLSVSPKTSTIDITKTNTVKIKATNKNAGKITWTSSNPNVATVSAQTRETGVSSGIVGDEVIVTAVSNGTTTITAEGENGGVVSTSEITVQTSPTEIVLNKTNEILDLSGTKEVELTASILPETANVETGLTWNSSDENVVSLNTTIGNTVTATGLQNGTAVITATTENGITKECQITVQTSPTEIVLNKENETLDMTGTKEVELTASILPETANVATGLTWSSSDENVVSLNTTIGNTVIATGKKNGTAVITATTENGITKECQITVQTSAEALSVVGARYLAKENASTYFATYAPETTSTELINWTIGDEEIVQIEETDKEYIKLKALKEGETTLTANMENGVSSTMRITVTSLTLNPDKATINLGEENKLTITSEGVNAGEITWQVDNNEIVSLDKTKGESVEVTGLQNGTAIVTAIGKNGNPVAKSEIIVQTSPAEVKINKENITLDITEQNQEELTATITPETANVNTDLIWTSSDETIVKVESINDEITESIENSEPTETLYNEEIDSENEVADNKTSNTTVDEVTNDTPIDTPVDEEVSTKIIGNKIKVIGLQNGTATVTVETENGKTATCEVEVTTSPSKIEMNTQSIILDINGKNEEQLTVTTYPETASVNSLTWTSSNENIVTVDETGKVKAIANGTADVTVQTSNGKTATCKITVQTSPTVLNVTGPSYIGKNNKETYAVTYSPETTSTELIKWTVGNQEIATVEQNDGTVFVKGIKEGETTLTAKVNEDVSSTITIKVTSINLNPQLATIDLSKNNKININAENNNAGEITWTIDNEKIISLNKTEGENVEVTGLQNGIAHITAKGKNGNPIATSEITVLTTKNEKEVDMSKDKEIDLKDILEKEGIDTSKIEKWESSDPTIATVDENGKVTGIENGTVTITATLEDGTKIEYEITITGIPEKPTTPGTGDINNPGGNNQGTGDSNNPGGNNQGNNGETNNSGGNQGTNNPSNPEDGWLLGDINLDKKVDVTDLLLLKRHLVSGNKKAWVLTKEEQNRGNMDRNKTVDITDLLLLKRELVK